MRKAERQALCAIAASWTYNGDGNPLDHAVALKNFLGVTDDDDDMDSALMCRACSLVMGADATDADADAFVDMWVEEGREEIERRMHNVVKLREEVLSRRPLTWTR